MIRMSEAEIVRALGGPHQAILAVGRERLGPLAVPMSFLFVEGTFLMVTPADSLHGRLMHGAPRATLTVHDESYPPGEVIQWYVMAEGHVRFTEADPAPIVRAIIAKDRPAADAAAWAERSVATATQVAELVPETIVGLRSHQTLRD